ncbi:MAG: hypothetical protein KDK41_15660 [Leptospiraceae bacterium]|nr:hypothetical protein [Leptospiraceae bacterium]
MQHQSEGLGIPRFFMVLSSLTPLFIIWSMRGTKLISEWIFQTICIALIVIPNLYLIWRLSKSKEEGTYKKVVENAHDHREHLIVYLFAMLLPFYASNLDTLRELLSTCIALAFIIFLFLHLNLHYMNIFFALFGYQVYTVTPNESKNKITGTKPFVLITKRQNIKTNLTINVYRVSNSVYWEKNE